MTTLAAAVTYYSCDSFCLIGVQTLVKEITSLQAAVVTYYSCDNFFYNWCSDLGERNNFSRIKVSFTEAGVHSICILMKLNLHKQPQWKMINNSLAQLPSFLKRLVYDIWLVIEE